MRGPKAGLCLASPYIPPPPTPLDWAGLAAVQVSRLKGVASVLVHSRKLVTSDPRPSLSSSGLSPLLSDKLTGPLTSAYTVILLGMPTSSRLPESCTPLRPNSCPLF